MVFWLIFFPWLFAVLALVLVAVVVLAGVPAIQSWQLTRLARQVGLGVPADLEPALRDRVRRRLRAGALGALAGLALGVVLVAVFRVVTGSFPGGSSLGATFAGAFEATGGAVPTVIVTDYGLLALVTTGSALAAAASSVRATLRTPGGPRVARLRQTRPSDYVPPVSHRLAWFVCAMAVVTIALALLPAAAVPRVVSVPGAALGVVGVLALAAYEVVSRLVAAHAQPAGDTDELVWDDALRSVALRDLMLAPLLGLFLGAVWSIAASPSAASPFAWVSVALGLFALFGFNFVHRRTSDWYLANLWPGARRRTPAEEEQRLVRQAEARRPEAPGRPTSAHAR